MDVIKPLVANATAAIDFICISGLLGMSLCDAPMKRDAAVIGRTNPRNSAKSAVARRVRASVRVTGICARSDCARRSADASGMSLNGLRALTRRVRCP